MKTPHLHPSRFSLLGAAVLAAIVPGGDLTSAEPPGLDGARVTAAESIRAEDLSRHISVLSADDFEGRAPAS